MNVREILNRTSWHLKTKGVMCFVSDKAVKGYSLHDFGTKIRALIILKKDTPLKMLLVLAHEIGHLFDVSDTGVLRWKPDDRELVANKRAFKMLTLIDPRLVEKFKTHYRKSLNERKAYKKI